MKTHLSDNILEGDRVKIARHFLKSTGCLTGDIPFWTGTVRAFAFFGGQRIANVQWDGQPGESSWLSTNLVRIQDLQFEDR